MYVVEYTEFTDRGPNPNTAHSECLTSELTLPSFRYRSGWNSSGLLKILWSCNIDLNKKYKTENRIKVVVLTMHYLLHLSLSVYRSHYIHHP